MQSGAMRRRQILTAGAAAAIGLLGLAWTRRAGGVAQKLPDRLNWPAVRLTLSENPQTKGTASRFGGVPDVPAGFRWPEHWGRPLDFLLQINLGDLAGLQTGLDLPATGRLLFFYDVEEQPWGASPDDAGSAQVIYLEDTDSLGPAALPLARQALPLAGAAFDQITTVPDPWSPWVEEFALTDDDRYELADAQADLLNYDGQIGGHPNVVQDAMEVDCELASSGIAPELAAYRSPRREKARQEATKWRLLLQLPSYEALGLTWADLGSIYFWIKEDALAQRDFSRVWLILQSA